MGRGRSQGSVCRKEAKAWVLAYMLGDGGQGVGWDRQQKNCLGNQRSNDWEAGRGPTTVPGLCQVAQKEAISKTERSMVSTHRRPQSLSITK